MVHAIALDKPIQCQMIAGWHLSMICLANQSTGIILIG